MSSATITDPQYVSMTASFALYAKYLEQRSIRINVDNNKVASNIAGDLALAVVDNTNFGRGGRSNRLDITSTSGYLRFQDVLLIL